MEVPAGRLAKAFTKDCFVDLSGTNHCPCVSLQPPLDLSGDGILRHKFQLHRLELLLDRRGELHAVVAGFVEGHGLGPELGEVQAGIRFILEDMDLGAVGVDHDGEESSVSGAVEGQKICAVRSAAKDALAGPVLGLGLVGGAVGLLLPTDKGADFLDGFGAGGREHLAHLDNPMALQFSVYFRSVYKELHADRETGC